jgi:hypothetical protein
MSARKHVQISVAAFVLALGWGVRSVAVEELPMNLRMRVLGLISQFDDALRSADIEAARNLFCDTPQIGYIGAHLAESRAEKGFLPIEELFKPELRDAFLAYTFSKKYLIKDDSGDISVSRDSEPRHEENGEQWTLFQSFYAQDLHSGACLRQLHMLERDF